ncbi:MAG: YraN family protein, partial [Calditrichaeota bacterium]
YHQFIAALFAQNHCSIFMMTFKQRIGKQGEDIAAAFLRKKGLVIVERNFRCHGGEIDIIAREERVLIFVEVKTTAAGSFGDPQLWVDERKQRRIGHAADVYCYQNGIEDTDCRFDVVVVNLMRYPPDIRHFIDAFWVEE